MPTIASVSSRRLVSANKETVIQKESNISVGSDFEKIDKMTLTYSIKFLLGSEVGNASTEERGAKNQKEV